MIVDISDSPEQKTSKADLHAHSKYSNRPSEWFLRRIGAPESYIEPLALYEGCRERGMDFVTITDHNNINGALDIADLPGVFISSEITTYFPEDRCKIHCLVWGITEQWFNEIQELRDNIHELREYLLERRIVHSIAHPLFRVDDRLSVDQFEKLLVMFNNFEVLNGSRRLRAGAVTRAVLESLTPEIIEELANRHNIEPVGPEPWKKGMTGGSDDHGGLYSAGAYTQTAYASNVFDFIEHLREGRMQPGGRAGSSVRLAHSLYKIAYTYYSSMFMGSNWGSNSLMEALIAKLSGYPERPAEKPSLKRAFKKSFKKVACKYREKNSSDFENFLIREISSIFQEEPEIFADAPDARSLAAAVRKALANPDTEETRVARSERIMQRYSTSVTCGQLLDLYHHLIARSGKTANKTTGWEESYADTYSRVSI